MSSGGYVMVSLLKRKKFDIWTCISLLILAFLLLFFVYPMITLLREAIFINGQFTLKAFNKFFSKSYYYSTIGNSFIVSFFVTIICLGLGIPFSYFYSFYQIKGKRLLFILSLLCTMSAPFIGAYSWILLLGRSGVITQIFAKLGVDIGDIYGFKGILLVQSMKLFPLVMIYMNGAFRNIDNSLLEAAENYGCKGVKRLFKIILVLIMPTVLAASLLVFMRAFADFGTPMLIGQGYKTFPVLIYDAFLGENGSDFNFASAVSVIAIIITGLVFLFQKYVTEKFNFSLNSINKVQAKPAKGVAGIFMHLYCYILVLVALLPNVYIIYMSFRNYNNSVIQDGYSFNNYILAGKRMLSRAIGNTLLVSFFSLAIIIIIAVLLAYLVARKSSILNNTIDIISMLPYIMPGSVIGIALIVGFNKSYFRLTGTLAIMVIALTIRRMPFTSRSATATMMQVPISAEEAAISLGASKLRTFTKVTVPMITSGIVSGAVLSFASIVTEMSSTVILYNNKTITLTIGTYSNIVRGTTGVAAVFATVTTIFTIACMVLYILLSKNDESMSI